MFRTLLAAPLALALALPAAAEDAAREVFDALRLGDLIEVMAREGVSYGDTLAGDMFPGRAGSGWQETVAAIYDPDAMEAVVLGRLRAELEGVEVGPIVDFFTSDTGRRIVDLELSAREAMVDDDIEEAAIERYRALRAEGGDFLELLDAFVEVNDLVEQNVVGAMNSNLAFYKGLMAGGAFGRDMTEDQALRDVWAQEPEIRTETEEWVYGYLALAYAPLDAEELQAYVDFSRTPEGQALNRALFSAFDDMYVGISRALGRAAAGFMLSEDI